MDGKVTNRLTGTQFKVLLTINIVTLLAVVVVFLNQPPTDPRYDRLVQVVEAQDWLIGKTSEELRKTTVELVKLEFGRGNSDAMVELENTLKAYEAERNELGLDLDKSREKIDAEYKKLLEGTESDSLEEKQAD